MVKRFWNHNISLSGSTLFLIKGLDKLNYADSAFIRSNTCVLYVL